MNWRRHLITFAAAFFLPLGLFGQGKLCNEHHIEGFLEQTTYAYSHFKEEKTHSIASTTLYVSGKGDDLYVQSNYLPRKYRYSKSAFPSKAYLRGAHDLKELSYKLFQGDVDPITFETAYRMMEVFIDRALVESPLFPTLDLGGLETFTLVSGGRSVGKAKRFNLDTQEPKWVVEVGEHLFTRLDLAATSTVKEAFSRTPVDKNSLFLLPLIEDKATKDEIVALIDPGMVLNLDLNAPATWGTTLSKIKKGGSLFVFGHMDGEFFVMENAAGQKTGTLKLSELEKIAQECCGINIFALGCNSASATHKSGVNEEFNTVDMVQRFHLASTKASDYWSFFTLMARDHGKHLEFVLDKEFITDKGTSGAIGMYKKESREAEAPIFKSVGRIMYATVPPVPPPPIIPDPDPPHPPGYGCAILTIVVTLVIGVMFTASYIVSRRKSI